MLCELLVLLLRNVTNKYCFLVTWTLYTQRSRSSAAHSLQENTTSSLFSFRWDISVICPRVALKLAVKACIGQYFQTLWTNGLNFFRSFEKKIGPWPKEKPIVISRWSSTTANNVQAKKTKRQTGAFLSRRYVGKVSHLLQMNDKRDRNRKGCWENENNACRSPWHGAVLEPRSWPVRSLLSPVIHNIRQQLLRSLHPRLMLQKIITRGSLWVQQSREQGFGMQRQRCVYKLQELNLF